jgi:hypothetical protein
MVWISSEGRPGSLQPGSNSEVSMSSPGCPQLHGIQVGHCVHSPHGCPSPAGVQAGHCVCTVPVAVRLRQELFFPCLSRVRYKVTKYCLDLEMGTQSLLTS